MKYRGLLHAPKNRTSHRQLADSPLTMRGLMLHTFRGNKPKLIARIASLLIVAMMPGITSAQSPPLHIRVINAKTNQPITNERLNVALKTDQIGSVAMATDKNGIILVNYGGATIIRILANMHGDCRPRAELYTNYPIDTILKSGITTGNLCSDASPKARPGELILFETPKTYIPTYPNPPADSIPHHPN
jgi:hypothetical protein